MRKFKSLVSMVVLALVLISSQAFATITYSVNSMTGPYSVGGQSKQVVGYLDLTGTYANGGFTLTPGSFGLSHLQSVLVEGEDGYMFFWNSSTGKVYAFQTATLTPTGTVASTFSGTGATISPTATSSTPTFSGTGATISPTAALAAQPRVTIADGTTAYPVYFDTSSHTLYVEGGGYFNADSPNITVTGASYTPEGTVSTPTITVTGASYTPAGSVASAFTGAATTAAPLAEVGAGVSLAGVDKINFVITGW
jgi:hypothetical protein